MGLLSGLCAHKLSLSSFSTYPHSLGEEGGKQPFPTSSPILGIFVTFFLNFLEHPLYPPMGVDPHFLPFPCPLPKPAIFRTLL